MRWQREATRSFASDGSAYDSSNGNGGERIMTRFAIPLVLFILLVALLAVGLRHDRMKYLASH